MLRRSIESKSISRFIEAHSPLSALVGEKTSLQLNGKVSSFDGFGQVPSLTQLLWKARQ